MSVMISKDGAVLFNGQMYTDKTGLYTSSISVDLYRQLQQNFVNADIDGVKEKYSTRVSDQETISITFIKDGKIYKSVNDYGDCAPEDFRLGYAPLRNLYKQLKLKKADLPGYLNQSSKAIRVVLVKGNQTLDLPGSEAFLLFNYIRLGKTGFSYTPALTSELHMSFGVNPFPKVLTNGRFYQFTDPATQKNAMIDIGFNFFDLNFKGRAWRQKTEYD